MLFSHLKEECFQEYRKKIQEKWPTMGFEPATTSLQTVFSVHTYVMFKTPTIVDTILCVMLKLRKKKELPPPI